MARVQPTISGQVTLLSGYCLLCGGAFTIKRANLRHQKFCSIPCQQRHRYLRRREREKLAKTATIVSTPREAMLDATCWCGARLNGVGLDWLGRTVECCTAGHETFCTERRRA